MQLLAQEHTVVTSVPEFDSFVHDPGMTVLPSGAILVASPCWQRGGSERRQFTLMSISRDGGRTWEQLDRLPYADATPFHVAGRLYMFVQREHWKDVAFVESNDEGRSWSDPSVIYPGAYWNCSTPMVERDDRLYWALSAKNWLGMAVLSADLSKSLLDPAAWRISETIRRPETPPSLTCGQFNVKDDGRLNKYWGPDNWLEPNIFVVNGQVRIATRTVIDEQAAANIACIGDVTDDGTALTLRFSHFAGWPGGQNKFFILTDRKTGYFWMLSNLVSDSQDVFGNTERARLSGYRGSLGNERRTLALSYSVDALNWFPAGIVAQWPGMLQSFMYPSAAIDGDDIIFVSRTSHYARHQHDADRTTFHRIRDFRRLALDIVPTPERFKRLMPEETLFSNASPEHDILGRWMWFDGRPMIFAPDGALDVEGGGSWELGKDRTYTIEAFGERTTMSFLGDGTLLVGQLESGAEVWAVRQPQ
jgi:hypothetical protein